MGDPRRQKNTYSGPRHPWERERIDEEAELIKEYGLKNKKEIWKHSSFIKKIKAQVVALNNVVGEAADQQKSELMKKLVALHLLEDSQTIDDGLNLTTKDIMERRLQTQVVRANLARTMKQARQFIVHGHIKVDNKKITAPGYTITRAEEVKIEFVPVSNLADPEHPERKVPEAPQKIEEEAKEAPKEETLAEEVEKEIAQKIEEEA